MRAWESGARFYFYLPGGHRNPPVRERNSQKQKAKTMARSWSSATSLALAWLWLVSAAVEQNLSADYNSTSSAEGEAG